MCSVLHSAVLAVIQCVSSHAARRFRSLPARTRIPVIPPVSVHEHELGETLSVESVSVHFYCSFSAVTQRSISLISILGFIPFQQMPPLQGHASMPESSLDHSTRDITSTKGGRSILFSHERPLS